MKCLKDDVTTSSFKHGRSIRKTIRFVLTTNMAGLSDGVQPTSQSFFFSDDRMPIKLSLSVLIFDGKL